MRTFIIIASIIFLLGCGNSSLKENNTKEIVSSKVIDSEYLLGKTTYFNINNDSIIGNGKETLLNIFQESEFVVYGERHNSKETSNLINAIIPLMTKNNFKTMGFEVGPNSAAKLEELMKPYNKTTENLKQFNALYYNKEWDDYPIPFFTGVEDAKFLETASRYGMKIWGLDQEYYYSILYLTDELLKIYSDDVNFAKIKNLKEEMDVKVKDWFMQEIYSENEIDVFSELLKEPVVIDFFNATEGKNEKANTIIKDIKLSWDIYSRWRKDSHVDRISYMRNNFLANYESEKKEKGIFPKVFLKFGQVHAQQIISKGAYDIGHFVNELAKNKGVSCTNINSWTRFYEDEGMVVDYLEKYPNNYARLRLFMDLAKQNQWTIIDLKSIREDVLENKVHLPKNGDFHKINALIEGYDYQFVLPLDQYITPNM